MGNPGKSGLVSHRARLSIGADPKHHEARIDFRKLVVAKTPALERAWTEVFENHVGLGDQFAEYGSALGRAQVEGDRFLVARFA